MILIWLNESRKFLVAALVCSSNPRFFESERGDTRLNPPFMVGVTVLGQGKLSGTDGRDDSRHGTGAGNGDSAQCCQKRISKSHQPSP
jgi:hypothetical protein